MAVQKPSIPKGTRDFSPAEMVRRNYMFDTIREEFRRYGFAPLETPAMENLSTLMGKYGEEGDKLLFKILNSGDFAQGVAAEALEDSKSLAVKICEKGLRYDLTVPFARFVVQHRNEITLPFRRYQIQPVWRADRPQKGRYREFYQCDVDVVGSKSLVNEVELIQIVESVFAHLGIAVTLKMNNRKILAGIAETIGYADKIIDITVAIDKLEKIGIEAVNTELASKDISPEAIAKLQPILELKGTNADKLNTLEGVLADSLIGMKGISEMREIFALTDAVGSQLNIELDLSLARGLNYYTGAIFEVKANDYPIGSICGGGRYDDLTGIFGMPDTSGVGISFGADRIYDVLTGLNLFPEEVTASTKAIFVNFGGLELNASLRTAKQLRQSGIACEVYPDSAKIGKQMEYANKRGVRYVIIIGSDELAASNAIVKDMKSGSQVTTPISDISKTIL